MNKGFDNFRTNFASASEFLKFLEERELSTERHEVPADEVRFITIDESLKYYKTYQALAKRLGVTAELLEDTKKRTNIVVAFNKNAYLLGDSAWISLKNRMNIYGDGFDQLGAELQATVLNKRFSQLGKTKVKVIIVDKKIRSIMSEEYAIVPASLLFKTVLQHIEGRFGGYEFVTSYVDHNVTRCKVLLTALANDLNKVYNLPDKYIPGIMVESSDTGFSANKIGPYWQMIGRSSGTFINQNEYIYMVHKGNTNLDKVLDELPNVFLKYQNTLKKFAMLMQIELDMPVKVLKKACKHIGLSKKITKQLVAQFELNYQNVPAVTAYDVCREILFAPQLVDGTRKTVVEEKVGKAINLNYQAMDEEDDE